MEQQLLQSEIPAASRQPRGAVASKYAPGTAWVSEAGGVAQPHPSRWCRTAPLLQGLGKDGISPSRCEELCHAQSPALVGCARQ